MDLKEIKELVKLVNSSDVGELKIQNGDFKISIRSQGFTEAMLSGSSNNVVAVPAAAPAAAAPIAATANSTAAEEAPKASIGAAINSPMIGTFYRSSSPDKPPFVSVGDTVNVGDTICIIEAMKLFNEIEAEVSGKIVKVLIDDATPVEYGQPIFEIEPA